MPKSNHIIRAIQSKPWAIQEQMLHTICEIVALRAQGIRMTAAEVDAKLAPSREAAAARPRAGEPGGVALINVLGVMMNRASILDEISGAVSAETVAAQIRAADANPDIKAIILNIDSPGGMVAGIPELAAAIANCSKYVVAVANQLAASAAYWIASQADEVVVSPSGEVGSIGVVSIHQDLSEAFEQAGIKNTVVTSSKYKYEGNPYEPLGEEALADMQATINAYDDMFTKAVAKGRGVSVGTVRNNFGQGRTLMAADAVKAGMADRVATLQDVAKGLGGTLVPMKRAQAALPANAPQAEENKPEPVASVANDAVRAQVEFYKTIGAA